MLNQTLVTLVHETLCLSVKGWNSTPSSSSVSSQISLLLGHATWGGKTVTG